MRNTSAIVSRLIGLCSMVVAGCATTFLLPDPMPPVEDVYLLEYSTWGHHSVVFRRAGSLIEFTYGDWELFALDKRDGWTAWKNMTFPTPGALGRKIVDWKKGPVCFLFVGCIRSVPFSVSTAKSNRLLDRLMAAYEAEREHEVYNDREDVHFVPYGERYSFHHNCNHVLVSWLEELGGKVNGRIFYEPTLIDGMRPRRSSNHE